MADFPASSRYNATGFSINTKGYVGTGDYQPTQTLLNDFLEWDQATNTWVQKTAFAGLARYAASGFSIGSKGYIGIGWAGKSIQLAKDFWEWDQATNIWMQKADFVGSGRERAVAFNIGNYGYIGGGDNGTFLNDFWIYDPSQNYWAQMASLPDTFPTAGFSINNKGYVLTYHGNFWEFTPNGMGVSEDKFEISISIFPNHFSTTNQLTPSPSHSLIHSRKFHSRS